MSICGCGAELPGRRKVCDACKALPSADRPKTPPGEGEGAAAAETPLGLRGRGQALWAALAEKADTPRGVIALEACRTADRLDELDDVIAGKGVLNLLLFRLRMDLDDLIVDDTTEVRVEVTFSNVLATAATLQASLRSLLGSLEAKATPAGKGQTSTPAAGQPAEKTRSPLDELEQRRRRGQ